MFSVDTVTRFPDQTGNEVLGPGSYNPGEYGGFGNAKKCERKYRMILAYVKLPTLNDPDAVDNVVLRLNVTEIIGGGFDAVLYGLGVRGSTQAGAISQQSDADFYVGTSDPSEGATLISSDFIRASSVKTLPHAVGFSSPQLTSYVASLLEAGGGAKSVVFGGLDGILTSFAIVAGAVGAGLPPVAILAMGFSNVIADAISLGAGEYLSSRAYNDYVKKEMEREKWELENYPEGEMVEMIELFQVFLSLTHSSHMSHPILPIYHTGITFLPAARDVEGGC